jgi:hypothetical protein
MAANQNDGIKRDWRALCVAAVEEVDSDKLVCLVDQILQAFDEHDRAVTLSSRPSQYCGQA